MKKRLLSLTVIAVLLLALAPVTQADNTETARFIEVVPCQYDYIYEFQEGLAAVRANGKTGFINTSGEVVIPPIYTTARSFNNGLAAVSVDDKYGFINKSGEMVITPMYNNIAFSNTRSVTVVSIGKMVYYSDAESRPDSYYEGKWGLVNHRLGAEVIPPIYDSIDIISENAYAVTLDGKCGLVDATGREITPMIYRRIHKEHGGRINNIAYASALPSDSETSYYGKWGLLDVVTGKELTPFKYDSIMFSNDGMAMVRVQLDDKYGFVDKSGKEVVPLIYDEINWIPGGINWFSDGMATVKRGYKWGCVDVTGTEVIPFEYDYLSTFVDGMAAFGVNHGASNKYGIIDKTGTQIVPPIYNSIYIIEGGFAVVRITVDGRSKAGVLNNSGELIVPIEYDLINIENGIMWAWDIFDEGTPKGAYSVFDLTGKRAFQQEYGYINPLSNGLFLVQQRGMYGVIDVNENILIPFESSERSNIGFVMNGWDIPYFTRYKDDKRCLYDLTGREIVPPIYDNFRLRNTENFVQVESDNKWGVIFVGDLSTAGSWRGKVLYRPSVKFLYQTTYKESIKTSSRAMISAAWR